MAITTGAVKLGQHIKQDEEEVYKQWLAEQKKAQKRGRWSSIGRTLGSFIAPMILGGIGGPAGAIAGKMIAGRLGAEAGETLAGRTKGGKFKKIGAGKHGFGGTQGKLYQESIEDAMKNLDQQQWMTSVTNPLIEAGGAELMSKGLEGTKLGDWYKDVTTRYAPPSEDDFGLGDIQLTPEDEAWIETYSDEAYDPWK